MMISAALRRFEKSPPFRVGLVLVVALAVVGLALFQKTRIITALTPGEELTVVFARDYRLRADVTKVKVAGVPVGIVTGVKHRDDGTAAATLHLDRGVMDKLRAEPSAAIRPTTLLGGNYYVELKPGGDPSAPEGEIPASRTTTPVELDRVLEVLNPQARKSTQRTVDRVDSTLEKPGRQSVRQFVKTAPATLEPGAAVLQAMRGTRPDTDLSVLVSRLEDSARALQADPGRLDGALVGLAATSSILAETSPQVATAIADLPATLHDTRTGLTALGHTLDEVRTVADEARPAARQLDGALASLDPALRAVAPVVRDLRPALADLRPTVEALVPSAISATTVVGDLSGAPINRIRGPVVDAVNSSWKGTGDYAHGGNGTVLYKELGDLIAGMNNAGRMTDRNGSTIHFQPGVGVGSLSGLPISFEQLLMQLAYPEGSP
jgi:phospholipid/cholesterol/gamma-HCH transport system substrate-binding protein